MKLPVVAYIDIISSVLPVSAGIFRWKVVRSELFVAFCFVVIGFVTELVTLYMALKKMNNLWVLHSYNLIEYTLLAIIFSGWRSEKSIKLLIRLSIPLYALFWLLSKWWLENWSSPAVYTHTLSAVVFTFLSAFALIGLLRNRLDENAIDTRGETPMYMNEQFWFSVGVLLYFTGNVTLFLLVDTVTGFSFLDASNVWSFHWALSSIVNICFMITFLCPRQQ